MRVEGRVFGVWDLGRRGCGARLSSAMPSPGVTTPAHANGDVVNDGASDDDGKVKQRTANPVQSVRLP